MCFVVISDVFKIGKLLKQSINFFISVIGNCIVVKWLKVVNEVVIGVFFYIDGKGV